MEYSFHTEENHTDLPYHLYSYDANLNSQENENGNQLSNSNPYQLENEYDYMPEFSKKQYNHISHNFKKRPTNSLDYMKFESEDYLRFKIENKVRDRIKELNLGSNLENQIFEVCFNFYKKFKEKSEKNMEKIRLCDLIPIVAYKFIKYNRLPIYDAIEKLNLDKGKFSNQIPIGVIGNIVYKIEDRSFKLDDKKYGDFFDKLFYSVSYMIQKLSDFYKIQPECLKIQKCESLIDFYFTNFEKIQNVHSKDTFFDILKFLQVIKQEAKELIYSYSKIEKKEKKEKKDLFYEFFFLLPVEGLVKLYSVSVEKIYD